MKQCSVFVAAATLLNAAGLAALSAPPAQVHVRGTLRAVSSKVLSVSTATGVVRVRVIPPLVVRTLTRSSAAQIKDGAFVGVTSVRRPDGTQHAVEVHIFAKSMRGSGEGSRDWDLPGLPASGSRMTNGTLSRETLPSTSRMTNGTVRRGNGSIVTVRYKGSTPGAQTIVMSSTVPVVAMAAGTRRALNPGAHVFIVANRKPDGSLATSHVTVGLNGLVPPM